jgi:phage replication-related protein YjqB (UPF0714/DUF867 family)
MGIQLEITSGLRRRMFKGLSRAARAETTLEFDQFTSAVQAIIDEIGVRQLMGMQEK